MTTTMTTGTTTQTHKVMKFARRRAFESIRKEVEAMPPDDVARPTGVAASAASALVLRAVAAATPHSAALEGTFVEYDDSWLERLRTLALAAAYTETELSVRGSEPATAELGEEGRELRRKLLSSARVLVDAGFLDPSVLETVGRSYQQVAVHLGVLADAFGNGWPQIHDKTVVTRAEVKRADAVAQALVLSLGVEVADDDTRARVLTLLASEYGRFRAAVAFLRRDEGDSDRITPALQGGRGRARPTARTVTSGAAETGPPDEDLSTDVHRVPLEVVNAPSESVPPGRSERVPRGRSERVPRGRSERVPRGRSERVPPGRSESVPPGTNGNSGPSVPAPC